jgi:hypothetical protein
MNSVDRSKAGAASGVLSMSRMVGGTFGVAVMGALITTIGHSKINNLLPNLPSKTRAGLANALGSGTTPGHASTSVVSAVHQAFVSSLGTGLLVGAIVTFIGAGLAWFLIEPRVKPLPVAATEPSEEPAPAELTAV